MAKGAKSENRTYRRDDGVLMVEVRPGQFIKCGGHFWYAKTERTRPSQTEQWRAGQSQSTATATA